jgi:hypothetical protein
MQSGSPRLNTQKTNLLVPSQIIPKKQLWGQHKLVQISALYLYKK